MDVDELLQQVRETRFPSAWEGCLTWASGLVSWHLAHRPTTWAPLQDLQEQGQTYIHHVSTVVACALHATAVDRHLDAPNGTELLRIPLAPAAVLLGDGVLDVLAAADPPETGLASLLHSIPVWIDAGDDGTCSKAWFIIEQARDVVAVHAEYGYAVGDRLRAALENNQLLDDLRHGTSRPVSSPGSDAQVYDRAQAVEIHMMAINNLEAMRLADQTTGPTNQGMERQALLERAALADRITLGLGEHASDDAHTQVRDVARALLDWDRDHGAGSGPVSADAPKWTDNPVGYLRQEYGLHLDRMSQPLLGD